MNIKFDRAGVNLEADRFLRLQKCKGTKLECRTGSLWITQDMDTRDYILSPGETLELEHGGDAIVFALMQSELVLSEPAPKPALLDGVGRALLNGLDALGNWIAGQFGPDAITKRGLRIGHGF
jgi:hypothetical protein